MQRCAVLCAVATTASGRCACLGGAGYGNECAHWDAADEQPWCRVAEASSCGADDTFESSGHFWAHAPCGTKGAPFDAARSSGGADAAAYAALEKRFPGLESAEGGHPVVLCQTSLGPFAMELRGDWAPRGAARVLALVKTGFFSDIAFFRVNQWITQFGADSKSRTGPFAALRDAPIKDDPNPFEGKGWTPGMVAMPGGGPNTRTSQLLVVRKPNSWNGGPGQPNGGAMGAESYDAPVGRILGDGMERVFNRLYEGYGDMIDDPNMVSPDQTKIFSGGSAYLTAAFPKLDWLRSCKAAPDAKVAGASSR